MRSPLVTVVIPTYNRENTIIRALKSVLDQSYTNMEVIIVDDCSTDNTISKIKSINDKRVRIIKHNENKGGSAARNTGISLAKGELVAFQDSDDEWLPGKLKKQVDIITQNRFGVIFTKHNNIRPNGQSSIFPNIDGIKQENLYRNLLYENIIGTPTALIQKKHLQKIRGFDESLPRLQDWDLFIRLSRITNFHLINSVECNAYLQDNSISKDSAKLIRAIEVFENKYLDVFEKYDKLLISKIYNKFGSLLAREMEYSKSRKFFLKSVSVFPMNIRSLSQYLLTFGGGALYRKFTS
jgi:glycosyltransferase involved in cell wall biosynthesis